MNIYFFILKYFYYSTDQKESPLYLMTYLSYLDRFPNKMMTSIGHPHPCSAYSVISISLNYHSFKNSRLRRWTWQSISPLYPSTRDFPVTGGPFVSHIPAFSLAPLSLHPCSSNCFSPKAHIALWERGITYISEQFQRDLDLHHRHIKLVDYCYTDIYHIPFIQP